MAVISEWATPVTDGEVRPLDFKYNPNFTVEVRVYYENDGVALTPGKVLINEDGYVFLDLADDTTIYMVGVPAEAEATGNFDFIQVGGPVTDMVVSSLTTTKGLAMKVINGAVGTSGAVNLTAACFGIAREVIAAANALDTWLIPRFITAAT
jgi:hypothetical protein